MAPWSLRLLFADGLFPFLRNDDQTSVSLNSFKKTQIVNAIVFVWTFVERSKEKDLSGLVKENTKAKSYKLGQTKSIDFGCSIPARYEQLERKSSFHCSLERRKLND